MAGAWASAGSAVSVSDAVMRCPRWVGCAGRGVARYATRTGSRWRLAPPRHGVGVSLREFSGGRGGRHVLGGLEQGDDVRRLGQRTRIGGREYGLHRHLADPLIVRRLDADVAQLAGQAQFLDELL